MRKKSLDINTGLVQKLIAAQFPQYSTLKITPVRFGGIDNRTFHLGEDMLVRLPSADGYASQVLKEQQWLPQMAKYISMPIPTPLHMGNPTQDYPWNWSIYRWLPGTSVNQLDLMPGETECLAESLAKFIKELHKVPIQNAPEGGLHNYYRGCHLSVYDKDARANIDSLKGIIDHKKALALWEAAASSKWSHNPVWVHGDLAIGNILMQDGKLAAVIDFGCMGVGDPACDLVIAWIFFDGQARSTFKDLVGLEHGTWVRSRGWALWKANFELASMKDKSSPEAEKKIRTIHNIING